MDLDNIEQNANFHSIPPKRTDPILLPTNLLNETKPTYYDKLVQPTVAPTTTTTNTIIIQNPSLSPSTQIRPIVEDGLSDCISFTQEEKQRIYAPWLNSVIIKLLGKRLHHQYLNEKLKHMWKLSEDFPLIDLGEDYYIAKFHKHESLHKVLTEGPWFVNGFFLTIRCWEPNFVASDVQLLSTAIWIRLPNLPTEFFDEGILRKIGNNLGKLLKIDFKTSTALRARYARLCIEVSLDTPVKSSIFLEHHKQCVVYEGANLLCKSCGRLSHLQNSCPYSPSNDLPSSSLNTQTTHQQKLKTKERVFEWQTVSFPKKKKNHKNHISFSNSPIIENSSKQGSLTVPHATTNGKRPGITG